MSDAPDQREVPPTPDEAYAGPIVYDGKDQEAVLPPIEVVPPPKGAVNVLVARTFFSKANRRNPS